MKKTLIILISVIFLIGLVQVAISGPPPGKITISVSGTKDATFDHAAHVSRVANCQECHHKDAKGSEQKCIVCHTVEGKDGAIPGKKAFHDKCGGCHKKEAKGPQYPKGCKECHLP